MGSSDFTTLSKRIRSLLFRQGRGPAGPAGDHLSDTAEPGTALDAQAFAVQLRELIHDHGQVAVGRLQIIGFHAVQERLGDRWPQMQERIPAAIESVFRRRLSPRDVFRRHDALVYLVLFAELSLDEARIKAHLIAEEIWRQLFGMGGPDDKIDVSLLTINLETNQIENAPDLDTLLARQFEAAAIEAASLHQSITAPQDRQVLEAPIPQAAAGEEPEVAGHTYLSFAPIWATQHDAVTSYYARMCLIGGPLDVLYGHDILRRRESAPRMIYDFDLATLARVHAAAFRLGKKRSPAVLVCPVHYTTLVNREARQEYLALCAQLPRFATRHIILEVCGLSEGFPSHIAFEIRYWLRSYFRAIWAQIPPSPAAIANLKDAGFNAVGFDARQFAPFTRLAKLAPPFVEMARRHKLRHYVHGLTTPQAVVIAAESGLDLLSGDAVQRPFDKVMVPYRLSLSQILSPHE